MTKLLLNAKAKKNLYLRSKAFSYFYYDFFYYNQVGWGATL
jgi:hypothetical protein